MIGEKIRLTGYGSNDGRFDVGTVRRITKTQVVVQFGDNPPDSPFGCTRFSLKTGGYTGERGWSGFDIPGETLEKLRAEAPNSRPKPPER